MSGAVEQVLNESLTGIEKVFKYWRLMPQTVAPSFEQACDGDLCW